MKRLHIDIETYSPEPIADSGLYRYAMHPDFDILLVAFAVDDEPVQIVDLACGQKLPWWFTEALNDPYYLKVAHNAAFERICFSVWMHRHDLLPKFQYVLNPEQWLCTAVQASRCGLPMSLAEAGAALGLEKQKMTEGKALIRKFCCPRPKKAGALIEDDGRKHPEDFPEEWQTFKDYCVRDVEVERQIDKATSWYPVPEFDRQLYVIDQIINDWGVMLDLNLVKNAVFADTLSKARLNEEAMKLTGLSNPNSVGQLKEWISEVAGIELSSLTKKDLPDIKAATEDPRVHRVLQIRAEMGKTSNAKYQAMLDCVCPDGRVHGLLQFYGSRTGRWAGRLVQVQNLPQNHIDDLDFARRCLEENDIAMLELGYGNVPDTLSQLIRTAFVAPEGKTLAVCDFSAIEARVLAWLAGENWVLDAFRAGKDIYCETASKMFHKPVEKHGQNAGLRQKGKIAVLALGYGGGVAALDAMGGKKHGMTEQEEKNTVRMWRNANPNIVELWSKIELAARHAVVYREPARVNRYISFEMHDDTLCCVLPSGRMLCYPKMKVVFDNDWAYLDQTDKQAATNPGYIVKEKKSLHPEKYAFSEGRLNYMGVNQTTNKWTWLETYGGKLTENITQAVARDCLAAAMTVVSSKYPIVFHVHDELICEVPEAEAEQALAWIQNVFTFNLDWNAGLPLSGSGYTTPYYRKD